MNVLQISATLSLTISIGVITYTMRKSFNAPLNYLNSTYLNITYITY